MKIPGEKIGIVIQARIGSTRLPGKVLMDFCGQPMLLFQINLLKQFNLPADIVVATSNNPLDDEIVAFCIEYGINYVRGSEDNVFRRLQIASERYRFDHIVRLTGDNPLTNYNTLTASLEKHNKDKPDLTSTRKVFPDQKIVRFAPKGNSVDIIKCGTLLNIDSHYLDDFEKEHVIPVFFNGTYRVSYVKAWMPLEMSFSIDDFDDFERICGYVNSCLRKGTLLKELDFEPVPSGRDQ